MDIQDNIGTVTYTQDNIGNLTSVAVKNLTSDIVSSATYGYSGSTNKHSPALTKARHLCKYSTIQPARSPNRPTAPV